MPRFTFSTDNAPEPTPYGPVPEDWYLSHIVGSEIRETKAGGRMIVFEIDNLDSRHARRKMWGNVNIEHPTSEKAVEIGHQTLATICACLGLDGFEDTEELHGRPLLVKWGIEARDGYEPRNAPKGYRPAANLRNEPARPPSSESRTAPAPFDDDDIPF